jgi:hypothetical protein
MLLQYYPININVPHTSTCHIITEGTIQHGDTITVTSSVFSSIDFKSNQFKLSSGLDVNFYAIGLEMNIPEGGLDATLVCDDKDIFNMYVRP